ncbi:hypothetical protein ACFLVM_03160 [Chloroflexota bacterium]
MNFGVEAGEVFLFVSTGYLAVIFCDESVQALDSGIFLVIRPKVKNLGYGAIFLGFHLDLDTRDFLR